MVGGRIKLAPWVLALVVSLAGCGAAPGQLQVAEPKVPQPRSAASSPTLSPTPDGIGEPALVVDAASRAKVTLAEHAKRAPPSLGGAECLSELTRLGVPFRPMPELRGVETPVEIVGPIGPVTLWVNGGGPILMDCRLALALRKLAPLFEAHQLTRARFSGAYVFRTTRAGRLSHHAHGLALDVHDVVLGGQSLSVERDFVRRAPCTSDAQPLNRLACALREAQAFEELLTPDFNADHHDHFHWAVHRGPQTALALALAAEQARVRAEAERKAARVTRAAETKPPNEATQPASTRTPSEAEPPSGAGEPSGAVESNETDGAAPAGETGAHPPPPPPLPDSLGEEDASEPPAESADEPRSPP